MNSNSNIVYFDIAATTPLDPRVTKIMNEINEKSFGNPSSVHQFGQKAHNLLEKNRKKIANILSCHESEIFFTSGGTESNNIALQGTLSKGDHLITSNYEHPAILKLAEHLEKNGIEVTYIGPNSNGAISIQSIIKAMKENTKLVSIMYVNNEIGSINPINEIADYCNEKNVLFHTDAVQYIGKNDFNFSKNNIDLLSIGAHKFYGPKAVGLLYIKKGLILNPLFIGGGQEKGIRPGTENVSLISGMTEALDFAYNEMENNIHHIKKMEDLFITELLRSKINFKINGSPRLSGLINITFNDIDGQTLLMQLDMHGIAISYGSACASGSSKPSAALLNIGLSEEFAKKTVRISIGKHITKDNILSLVSNLESIIPKTDKVGEKVD